MEKGKLIGVIGKRHAAFSCDLPFFLKHVKPDTLDNFEKTGGHGVDRVSQNGQVTRELFSSQEGLERLFDHRVDVIPRVAVKIATVQLGQLPESTLGRIQKLQDRGQIAHFGTTLNGGKLGSELIGSRPALRYVFPGIKLPKLQQFEHRRRRLHSR